MGWATMVTLCYVVCVAGSVIGVGVLGGTPIAEAAGGLLATDATLLAPGSGAFSIWTVVYVGLGVYTLRQWWSPDVNLRTGWLSPVSMLLNAAWILTIQAGQVWMSVAVILVLLTTLVALYGRLADRPAPKRIDGIVTDVTFGLYLGWVCVAAGANVAAALLGSGFDGFRTGSGWAIAALAVIAVAGVLLAVRGRGHLAVTAALVWGLVWIAVARGSTDLRSPTVLVAALIAAAVVAVATVVIGIRARTVTGATTPSM